MPEGANSQSKFIRIDGVPSKSVFIKDYIVARAIADKVDNDKQR